jgi:predicted DsbA family dithiol-disulfide isomerase
MTDHVRFHFDPLCPWCYQTSLWIHRLAELGEITVDWGLFSLELANQSSPESQAKGHKRSELALRTCIVVRDNEGSDAVGSFYRALGAAVHRDGAAVDAHDVIVAALEAADLPGALLDKAIADDQTWERVRSEHRQLVEETASFGVPTIVLDGGTGPAIFGPVISNPPASDAEAVELWRHVSWLTRYDNFSELKRERLVEPDLESYRRFVAAQRTD